MSNQRTIVIDNTQVVTIIDTSDIYEYTITGDQYVYSLVDTKPYQPSLDFSDNRNSMYFGVLLIL